MYKFNFAISFAGVVHIIRSCGTEGFRHARKGTNIAAQTTGISISTVSNNENKILLSIIDKTDIIILYPQKALALGVRTARVRVQGIGPGRMVYRNLLIYS